MSATVDDLGNHYYDVIADDDMTTSTAERIDNGHEAAAEDVPVPGGPANDAPNETGEPDPADFNLLKTPRDMANYVLSAFEMRRTVGGTLYAVNRTTGERRTLQGDRRSRTAENTIREWLISERVEHSESGRQPTGDDLGAVIAQVKSKSSNAPQDQPPPPPPEPDPQELARLREIEEENRREELTDGIDDFREGHPAIRVDNMPVAVRALLRAMGDGRVPDLYSRGGALVWLSESDGEMATHPLSGPELSTHLGDHLDFWQEDKNGDERTVLCPESVASQVINRREHRLPTLERIVTTPVLLPNGRLLQTPGYDSETGIYYHPRHPKLPEVPETPSAEQVEKSRRFLLDVILGDFPWVSGETGFDRANYVAGLITPLFMSALNANSPMFLVTAPERGSGKTLLTDILTALYGSSDMPHVDDTTELRKQITAKLLETSAPCVVVDNIPNGHRIGNHVWATLLTKRWWEDRILGSTKQVRLAQDRSWWATGNNIGVRDDMRTRHYPVRIDPQQPNPDQRTGFRSEEVTGAGVYLGDWILGEGSCQEANGWRVLYALLVLVMDWVSAGRPEAEIANRGFTAWSRQVGGFLAHHDIGAMDRPEDDDAEDENSDRWGAFFSQWWEKFGSRAVTCKELLDSLGEHEVWPSNGKDHPMTSTELGTALRSAKGQFYGNMAAYRSTTGARGGIARWQLRQAAG